MKLRTVRRWLPELLPVVGLWGVVLFSFWLIGPAARVLAGGDLFTYFYPYWAGATRALRAGRLPLWDPYLFMGVPFLANSQAGVLYPLNWPLWWFLSPHRALHWSIIIHLWLVATGAYVYGRTSLRLGRLGAWTAGAALSLGGYLGAQVEHINQLQALAWFPWLLFLYDRALARRLWRAGLPLVGLAAVVGMVLLAGHTQAAFISLLGLVGYALLRLRDGGGARRRLGVLALAVTLGGLLAAAQLLPTLELAGLSVRAGGLALSERLSFSLSPLYLARALLPGYVRPVEPARIEYAATVGVTGLILLPVAVRSLWKRHAGRRDPLILAAVGLFLSLGRYNPFYWPLALFVPGFAHFRVPARWLALWAFGAAMLIGVGVERVARGEVRLGRREWGGGAALLAVLLAWGGVGGQADPVTVVGWLAAAVLAAGAVWLAQRGRRAGPVLLAALLVAELALAARTLPRARATAPQAYISLRPAAAHLVAAAEGRTVPDRFLSLSALLFDPGDLADMETIYSSQLSPAALYSFVVAAKQREVLSPNLPLALDVPAVDGYDGGVLPLARYLALQRAFLPEEQVSLDGRLRENLTQVPDGRWLDLLNVRYVITDKVFDAWVDDVFYDLQFGARLAAGEEAVVADVPPLEATALGLVSYLDGASSLADGTVVGEVVVGFADGTVRVFALRAGAETAEGLYGPAVAHDQATVGGHYWPDRPQGNDYVTRLRWDEPAVPVSVMVRALLPAGELVVRGLTLMDERTDAFQPLLLSDRGRFRLVHSGDVKVYENLDVLPRAFVVHRARVAAGEREAQAWLRASDIDLAAEVVLEGQAVELDGDADGPGDEVRVTAYAPERVAVEVDLAAPGYLVLTDANYPGWRAWVDGDEVEILTADLLFRAVPVGAGRHRVLFSFAPRAVRVGAWLSLAGLVALLALLVVARVDNWTAPR